jgi:hypothetical protein
MKVKYSQIINKTGILLVDFEDEEERDCEGVKLAVNRFTPVFTHLFEKYTAVQSKVKQMDDKHLP